MIRELGFSRCYERHDTCPIRRGYGRSSGLSGILNTLGLHKEVQVMSKRGFHILMFLALAVLFIGFSVHPCAAYSPDKSAGSVELRIKKVSWSESKKLLEVAGSGASVKSVVTLKDYSSGSLLGSVNADKKGDFKLALRLVKPPCEILVENADKKLKVGYSNGSPKVCGGGGGGGQASRSHSGRFSSYAGTSTCLSCHVKQAEEVHSSVHYQWAGDTRYAVDHVGNFGDKLGGINDFCIYPDINWLGKLTTVRGTQVDAGCAKCHVGLGDKPTPDPNFAQLENIDCLVCHSDSYKRKLELIGGKWKFVPDAENMSVTILQAAQDVKKPSSTSCLNCHTNAGGGNNYKRGDIEEAHRNPTAALDIHMAPKAAGGSGLTCLDCHGGDGHYIKGRGTDLRAVDSDKILSCSTCHSSSPHDSDRLNRHTAKVNCTVCHIPQFAKVAGTDIHRDWSASGVLDAASGLFEPYHTKGLNVTPVYRFFNGYSTFYKFGAPAEPGSNGKVSMSAPVGDITDPSAKIYAFKYHTAKQPMDPATRRLLPLKIGKFFESGQIAEAVALGTVAVGWQYAGHQYAETERYMGIFHEVAPKDSALSCSSCHVAANRIDFRELGYELRTQRNSKALCASCHGSNKAAEWQMGALTDFEKYHNKHVTDKRISCAQCHVNLK